MRKLSLVLLCLCLAAVACFSAYHGYSRWKQRHLMRQAHSFLARQDAANALLCLRQTLQSNPNNLEACRLMADFAELARSPQAVLWRNRVVELQPDSLTNRLALAVTALGAGDLSVAQRALSGVSEADKKTAVYHKVSGDVEIAARRFSEAEEHFSEAVRLEPGSVLYQLSLATLRVRRADAQSAPAARAALQALTANPQARCPALRQLTLDSIRHTNLAAAVISSTELVANTNAVFSDRLLHLEILHATTNAQESAFLASLQEESVSNPAKAYEIGKWVLSTSKPQLALDWLKALPPPTRTNLPVPMIEADCYMALKDWSSLLTNLAAQTWADLDCLRLASRARAFKEQSTPIAAKTEWLSALQATGDRLNLLAQLLTTASLWGWKQEQQDVLWAIVNRYPDEKWALQTLAGRLMADGNTRGLQSLFSVALRTDQTNLALMNNLANTALLLESWEKKPHELAREVFSKNGTNAAYVSTYAYSLLVQRQPDEALKVIERLSPQQLENSSIAAYYGLILSQSGQPDKATKYLELASKGQLLPEEQKLVEQAKKRN